MLINKSNTLDNEPLTAAVASVIQGRHVIPLTAAVASIIRGRDVTPHLLLVDDVESNLLAMKKVLSELDAEIITAKSGEEVLALVLRYEFALILMDVNMPGMSGHETAELLRGIESTRHIPILFVTGVSKDDECIFKGYDVGAVDYLLKPINSRVLKSKVKVFLELYRHRKSVDVIDELRHQIEERQQMLEKRRLITESALDGFFISDLQCGFLEVNEAFCVMLGFSRDELSKMNIADIVANESPKGIATCAQETILAGRHRFETRFRCKDSKIIDVDVSSAFLQMEGGQSVVFVHDITEQKRVQSDLRINAESLRHTNMELEQFAYVASHDLRAPLRAIDNLSQWIEQDLGELLTGGTRKHVELMRSRVRRMQRMIDDILQYSRAGRDETEHEVVNVGELLQEIIDTLAPPSGFVIEVSHSMPTLTTARTAIQQVFSNLIGNAIKHHGADHGHVKITVRDADKFYEFSVADDGVGIPTEFHEKVFKMFQTLKPRDEVEGTGIGLALVKKLMEHVGGTIRLLADQREGATFIIEWPKLTKGE